MTSNTIADRRVKPSGRSSEQVYASLRTKVLSGEIAVGRFLPTEREMAGEYGVAHTTVRRAMARLKADGLVRSEPRKGYRVMRLANDPTMGCPVAFIRSDAEPPERWDSIHMSIIAELQAAADRRGWPLMTIGAGAAGDGQLASRLAASRASAVIIDTHDEEVIQEARALGLPAMMLDSWVDGSGIDSVMQDGQHGGMLAAQHLAGLGCRRIAWFGPTSRNAHTMDRFGGVAAGLLGQGLRLAPEMIFDSSESEAGSLAAARAMLAGSDRPEGVVALWSGHALSVKRAADEAGLIIGRDIRLVGWCAEELYEREYAPAFAGGPVAPAVTWSIRAMADSAMAVLAERRAHPELPPLRIRVPANLRA